MITILVFIAVLSVLVFVHELGHFVTARMFGIGVDEFSIGFPPRIWSRTSARSGVRYTVGSIPIGGYVRIAGEDVLEDEHSDRWKKDQLFNHRPLWQRVIVLGAGVFMNVVLAFGLYLCLQPWMEQSVDLNTSGPNVNVRVTNVLPNTVAQKIGITEGSVVQSIAGQHIDGFNRLKEVLSQQAMGTSFPITWKTSDGVVKTETAIFSSSDSQRLGIEAVATMPRDQVWYQYPVSAFQDTYRGFWSIASGFWQVIVGAFTPGVSVRESVAGPVGIASVVGAAWRMGPVLFFGFVALLSLNLAFLNILPLPALDGGRIFAAVVDRVTRGKWSPEAQARVHQIGFLLLLALLIALTVQDVWRLIG